MVSERFARQHRLINATEFKQVFAHPCARYGDSTMLVLGRKNDLGLARLGLAVAKKQIKKAVRRNRLKRLVRESFRQHLDLLQGLDIVVVARSGAEMVKNREMLDAIENHWHSVKTTCDKSSQA